MPQKQADDWALIEVVASGVCGSDVHLLCGEDAIGRRSPVQGHEVVGIVRDAPGHNPLVVEGMKVACIPFFTCGACVECKADLPGNCHQKRGLGLDLTGGFASHVALPARCLVPLPMGVTDDRLFTLADGLAVVVNALAKLDRIAPRWREHKLLVVGDGTIGLLTTWLARHRGVNEVTLVYKGAAGRSLATSMGATDVVHASETARLQSDFPTIVEAVGGRLPDPYDTAFRSLSPGGMIMLLGVPGSSLVGTLNLRPLTYKESLLSSTNSYCRAHFLEAVDLIARHVADLGQLVTHSISFREAGTGRLASLLASRETEAIAKIAVTDFPNP